MNAERSEIQLPTLSLPVYFSIIYLCFPIVVLFFRCQLTFGTGVTKKMMMMRLVFDQERKEEKKERER